jgi:hypothetical protein
MNPNERFNIYTLIHKGLRACMADAMLTVGRMDPNDAEDVELAVDTVRGVLTFARSHLQHEEDWIHPALEAVRARSSEATRLDHLEHREAFVRLEASLRTLEGSVGQARAVAALRLYRQLALFVADNFQHMHVEETDNHATFVESYTDEAVMALSDRLVASLTPAEKAAAMRWMLPFANAAERAGVLANVRNTAPRPAFEALLELARTHLSVRDAAKLDAALGAQSAAAREGHSAMAA